jgi:hypothetical protein
MSGYSGLERDQPPFFRLKTDLDGIATDLTILDVPLLLDRQVEQHGNALTTMGAGEYPFPDYQSLAVQWRTS